MKKLKKPKRIDLILSCIATLSVYAVAIYNFMLGEFFWGVIFSLMSLLYTFVIIPISYKITKDEERIIVQFQDVCIELEKKKNKILNDQNKEKGEKDENLSKLQRNDE